MSTHEFKIEVASGRRFEFGKNWRRFLSVLDDDRISEAERSLKDMLGVESLTGSSFLDVGSGSGLFSLAAMRLGADRVHSFDFDPQSVACTREMRRRYFPDAQTWTVESGSVLDKAYLDDLGRWDIVYSWGVLHHTGDMHRALDYAAALVGENGRLFISIYNDQGGRSLVWRRVKEVYNRNQFGQLAIIGIFFPYFAIRGLAVDLLLRHRNPLRRYTEYRRARGMSVFYDWFDWLGGFPFEVAKPEEIFDFFQDRGFILTRLVTDGGGLGCNQFVFTRG